MARATPAASESASERLVMALGETSNRTSVLTQGRMSQVKKTRIGRAVSPLPTRSSASFVAPGAAEGVADPVDDEAHQHVSEEDERRGSSRPDPRSRREITQD